MDATAHGRMRCQQRGLSNLVVDLIVSFGTEVRARGASKYYLDRKGRYRLAQAVGNDVIRRLGRKLDSFVVMSDEGTLITAAPRRRRVWH